MNPTFKCDLKKEKKKAYVFTLTMKQAKFFYGSGVVDSLDKEFGKSGRWKMTGNWNNKGFRLR